MSFHSLRWAWILGLSLATTAGCGGSAGMSSTSGSGGASASASTSTGTGGGPVLDGHAHVLDTYTLPSTSIQVLNPALTAKDLSDGLANGAMTVQAPSLGSGIAVREGAPLSFVMITDRGPNADHYNSKNKKDGKTFPIPAFTPAVASVHLVNQQIVIDQATPIVDQNGKPVTGISNDDNDDTPFLNPSSSAPLPYNVNGIDPEEVEPLPGGGFLVSEEYGPSLVVIGADGKVKARIVPSGVSLAGAAYPVKSVLPKVLTNRRKNKGFECLALSPDGHTAIAALQTPMGDDKDPRYTDSRVVRLVRVDITDPDAPVVTGHFLLLESNAADYPKGNAQADLGLSAAKWLSPDKILLLERASGKVKLFVVDLSGATNLKGNQAENTLDPEDTQTPGLGYAALGLEPATAAEVFTTDDTPGIINGLGGAPGTDKLEGVAVIDKATVALSNDNDFGIADPKDPSRVWIVRLGQALP